MCAGNDEGSFLTLRAAPGSLASFVLTLVALVFLASSASAVEAIKISRDDVALDLSRAVEIYTNQGENFQVSTAPGPDGIVRRIEVEANDERSSGDWAVFALANTTDEQLDRLIVAPHFRLVGSGVIWPDLGANRIAAITPSEGFALDRQPSPDSDVFLVTLNPGTVVTFVAELASPKLPQVYLWDPESYKDTVNSYTLYRGIVIGISGLLALFLTILFVVKGTSMFPATAALAWAVLAYICVDFGFLNKVIEISPGNEQIWRAGTEVALAGTLVVFLFAYLNLNRWHGHFSYGALIWVLGLLAIAGVAAIDPAVAAGVARISFAGTAIIGLVLIVYLGIRSYDRAVMLIPSWMMVLVWVAGSWLTVTGALDNDIVQPALGGGLVLIILLIGFTVMQHAFAGRRLPSWAPATRSGTGMWCATASSPAPTSACSSVWRPTASAGRRATGCPCSMPMTATPSAPRSTSCWNTGAARSRRASACAARTDTTTGSRCAPVR
jgi:hypothetical protein